MHPAKQTLAALSVITAAMTPAAANPAHVADKAMIVEAITDIMAGVDRHQWSRVRGAMADRVRLDYTSLVGGQPSVVPADDVVKGWAGFLPGFETTQHLVANHAVRINGGQASAEADFQATHRIDKDFWVLGGRYAFEFAKQNERWVVTAMTMTWTWETGDRGLMARAAERAKARSN
jgi:hypothetical protein